MAYRMVFDTETTSINKPFTYDIGYTIFEDEKYSIVKEQHFVVEQAWHNLPLFESAYYASKRPLYVSLMKARKATMDKFGYITQAMIRDIKTYDIKDAYAYNSDFDTQVFNFNCDWYKVANPFDTVAIHDIWGYASQFIFDDDYQALCPWASVISSGKRWPDELTDAAVELFASEENNREQRRKKREARNVQRKEQ